MARPSVLDISKSTHRKHLKPRGAPYFRTLARGRAVGVRIGAKGESWIARYRKDNGSHDHKALPEAHDYDSAERLARAWFDQLAAGIVTGTTVEDACRSYVRQIETEKGEAQARDAGGRLRRRVYGKPFGKIVLEDLRQAHVEAWRDALLEVQQKSSANRDLAALKAALNRAYRGGVIDTDRAWRNVKPFPNAGTPRKRFLDRDERRALLDAADGAISNLIEACAHTAARPVEIHRATVADLDVFTRTLTLVGYKGKTGEARPREVPLTPPALAFFKRMAKGKLPTAPLVPRDDDKPWQHSDHDELFRAVRDKAGLPGDVTLYTVRHSVIAEWLVSGIDPLTVSKIAGTGMAMLERHYSKFLKERAAAAIATVEVL
jgi:integrase